MFFLNITLHNDCSRKHFVRRVRPNMKTLPLFAVVLFVAFFGVDGQQPKADKHKEYRIDENEIDDTYPTKNKKKQSREHGFNDVQQKPIALVVRTIKNWINAIPEAIATLFVNLLSPFIEESLIREKVHHFINSLIQLIAEEMPKPYANFMSQLTNFLDMFEMFG